MTLPLLDSIETKVNQENLKWIIEQIISETTDTKVAKWKNLNTSFSDLKNVRGIYCIKLKTDSSERAYFGTSTDLSRRLGEHRTCIKRFGHPINNYTYIHFSKKSYPAKWEYLEKKLIANLKDINPKWSANKEISDVSPPYEPTNPLSQENPMHTMNCRCNACRTSGSSIFEIFEFGGQPQAAARFPYQAETSFGARDSETASGETQETELAMELLSVSSEAELDQFLGKLVSGALKGVKKIGGAIGKIANSPLGGVLKTVAKTALPFVGGALGTLIPVPGVGTAVGTALGSAVSAALEAELGELESEQMELESARRFVRIARSAARAAALAPDSADPHDVARAAVTRAARQHLPNLDLTRSTPPARAGQQGRWQRQGNQIVLLDA